MVGRGTRFSSRLEGFPSIGVRQGHAGPGLDPVRAAHRPAERLWGRDRIGLDCPGSSRRPGGSPANPATPLASAAVPVSAASFGVLCAHRTRGPIPVLAPLVPLEASRAGSRAASHLDWWEGLDQGIFLNCRDRRPDRGLRHGRSGRAPLPNGGADADAQCPSCILEPDVWRIG